ncbi:MAG TPA: carbohydrate ABC transporter permease [bacterium]|nr:carbohydrate ABC transporter permease [bacterium]
MQLKSSSFLYKVRKVIPKIILYLLLIDGAFIFLYPLMRSAITSVMTVEDYLDPSVNWIPNKLNFKNYIDVLEPMGFSNALSNTVKMTLFCVLGQTLSSALVGYGLSRGKIPGKEIIMMLILATLVIPPQTLMIPYYILYHKLNLLDSLNVFIIPSFFSSGIYAPLCIFLFRQVFNTLPTELEDAAIIDGADFFRCFWYIYLPLSRTAVITVGLFTFVWYWNEYARGIIFFNNIRTLPIALSLLFSTGPEFMGFGYTNVVTYPMMMAAVMLTMLPCLILYLFTQRYYLTAIEQVGIKG